MFSEIFCLKVTFLDRMGQDRDERTNGHTLTDKKGFLEYDFRCTNQIIYLQRDESTQIQTFHFG